MSYKDQTNQTHFSHNIFFLKSFNATISAIFAVSNSSLFSLLRLQTSAKNQYFVQNYVDAIVCSNEGFAMRSSNNKTRHQYIPQRQASQTELCQLTDSVELKDLCQVEGSMTCLQNLRNSLCTKEVVKSKIRLNNPKTQQFVQNYIFVSKFVIFHDIYLCCSYLQIEPHKKKTHIEGSAIFNSMNWLVYVSQEYQFSLGSQVVVIRTYSAKTRISAIRNGGYLFELLATQTVNVVPINSKQSEFGWKY
ncbi:Hypothetical_protein [Hexamita inflata]|uniref:Hypothetical_protein n=1 Tax=Hexamita inflata TaxID=28002 RepID=A0AA86V0B1_9EUKA|nr:Hypothetical protein HINF_LOCUS63119 [Hexamita inflata]